MEAAARGRSGEGWPRATATKTSDESDVGQRKRGVKRECLGERHPPLFSLPLSLSLSCSLCLDVLSSSLPGQLLLVIMIVSHLALLSSRKPSPPSPPQLGWEPLFCFPTELQVTSQAGPCHTAGHFPHLRCPPPWTMSAETKLGVAHFPLRAKHRVAHDDI